MFENGSAMKKILLVFGFLIFLGSCTVESNDKIDFSEFFPVPVDSFLVDNRKDTLLIGRKGTKVLIPKYTFNANKIKIELQEFYSKADFLRAGLTTTSGKRIIKSKGMIHIKAFDGEKEVKALSKDISIQFASDFEDDYKIFNGSFDNDYIEWTEDTTTRNYRVVENHILHGRPCVPFDNCDYAITSVIIDSVSWAKSYTQYDTIVTFQESNDTLSLRDFWGNRGGGVRAIDNDYNAVFKSRNLNWINCDAFVNYDSLTEVELKISNSFYPYTFAVLKSQNSILPGHKTNNGTISFGLLPIGEVVNFIAFDKRDQVLYFEHLQEVKITGKPDLRMELKEKSIEKNK